MEGYTILSAEFVNEDHTAIVLQTVENGAVLVSECDRPALWEHAQDWILKGGRVASYTLQMTTLERDPIQELDELRQALVSSNVIPGMNVKNPG